MIAPFMSLIFASYLMLFSLSTIGILLYGEVVTLDKADIIAQSSGNPLYYMLNFNDYLSGILTLFAILNSNNWNSIAEMYCALTGTNWPKVYFAAVYICTIMVVLNIVISYVLEIYAVSLEESETKAKKISDASKLR